MQQNSNPISSKILLTGCAGFIGFHLCKRLLEDNFIVIGLDNLNNYYDSKLKRKRVEMLEKHEIRNQLFIRNFKFLKQDILNKTYLEHLFEREGFNYVIHLAAQAGVRQSLKNPQSYLDNNIQGFFNILELCKIFRPEHLIFASSSSVYGITNKLPFSINLNTNHPVSFYAFTKKTNELMAYLYSYLYNIPCTGLRFFTVYGPWGRPDMAYFDFTRKILKGEPIEIYNNGILTRDFTYIDDVIEGILSLIRLPPTTSYSDANKWIDDKAPFNLFNIGANNPVSVCDFLQFLEEEIGIKAIRTYKCMQPGDVQNTYADINDLKQYSGFCPTTSLKEGIRKFLEWYFEYFHVN